MTRISDLKSFLIDNGISDENYIVGCSEEELLDLEKSLSITLPASYKEFLKLFGKGAGPLFLSDLDFTLDCLDKNLEDFKEEFPDTYQEEESGVVVVFSRYGETFGYLRTVEPSDPELLIVNCDEDDVIRYPSLAEFLFAEAEELKKRGKVRLK